MKLDTIFKKDSDGDIRFWQAEVSGNQWRTISGIVNTTKPVISSWVVCKPKSQETAAEQALFEAHAEHNKKLARDYRETVEMLTTDKFRIKPMLAEKFSDYTISDYPVYSQPKLDGIRCLMTRDGAFTREGLPIRTVNHIHADLKTFFAENLHVIALDGELYNHDLRENFNKIGSLVRKAKIEKLTDDEWGEIYENVQYHVYDVILTEPIVFSKRWEFLINSSVNSSVQLVDTFICNASEDIDEDYAICATRGYEGQIVRMNRFYDHKRSKYLLKRKEFVSEEYRVLDIESGVGNWAGTAKIAICKNHHGGPDFGATLNGSYADNKKYLDNKAYYVGGMVTVKRFEKLTPGKVPRFPVACDFHPIGRID